MNWFDRLLCFLLPHQDIYKIDENGDEKLQLRRWFIIGRDEPDDVPIKDRTARLCIHKLAADDNDRAPHNHSFRFLTWIFYNSYNDEIYDWQPDRLKYKFRSGPKVENMWMGKIAYRNENHLHQVKLKDNKPAYSLVFMSKPVGTWGFVTEDGTYIDRKVYGNKM